MSPSREETANILSNLTIIFLCLFCSKEKKSGKQLKIFFVHKQGLRFLLQVQWNSVNTATNGQGKFGPTNELAVITRWL